ncbi:MAG: hypothetical protein ABH867_00915 [Patescibacteria group bacterium]|nr:hypothetical protein [Patescibacteria group bacterium]
MSIANQVKSLAEDIEASYGARVAAVSDIVKETRQTLGNFNREHKKMADDLRDSLSTSERERMKDFATLIADIKAAVESIEKDTTDLLSKFAQEHKEMAQALNSSLDESESTRIAEFKEMLRSIQSRQKEREEETAELLSDYQKDLSETKRHWRNLAKVMAAKRAGKSIPSPKAEIGVSVAVKEEAKEAFQEGELKERILKVVQAHPGGIKLSKIGKALRIAYIRTAKPVQELLAEVKITKRDSKYLPT